MLFSKVKTDAKLRDLILSELRSLYLEGPEITDESLTLIAANCSSSLRELSLSETKVTSRGLQSVAQLRSLNWLFVDSFEATDQMLQDLVMLPDLKGLHLVDTNVTDTGFASLKALQFLAYLEVVSINKIGVDAIRCITNKTGLEYLRLSATTTDEERFSHLELGESLRSFSFEMPFVSEEALAEMRTKFPHCHISRYRFQRSEQQAGYEEAMMRAIARSPVPTDLGFTNSRMNQLRAPRQELHLDMDQLRAIDDRTKASGLLSVGEVEMLIDRGLLDPDFRRDLYGTSSKES